MLAQSFKSVKKIESCPTCSRPTVGDEASTLLMILTNSAPHREIYRGRDGGWFVTYGGGQFSVEAVQSLFDCKMIVSVYSNCPADSYHVGHTRHSKRYEAVA